MGWLLLLMLSLSYVASLPPASSLSIPPLATEKRKRTMMRRRRRRRMMRRTRQMMKIIQSLIPLVREPTGILGWEWCSVPSPKVWFPLDSCFLVFCPPSAVPAVADTPSMCLNFKCMANIHPKASDPEGQRECLSVTGRTSPPVSVAPKKRTFSPWCVSPSHMTVFPVVLIRDLNPKPSHPLCFPPSSL